MSHELLEVTRQLALAARTGVPLAQALRTLPPEAGRWLGPVNADVEKGDTLAQALARHPRAFSPFYSNLIEAAEAAEKPAGILTALSRWLEASDRLERELRTAMLYPYFLVNALCLFVVMLGWVAPRCLGPLNQALEGHGAIALWSALPWAAVSIVGAVALVGFNLAVVVGGGRRLAALVPGMGKLLRQAQEALWARALGTLLSAGLPLPQALERAAAVVSDEELRGVAAHVTRGGNLAEALPGANPTLLWSLRRGGEDLAGLLLFAAEHLETEVELQASHRIREASLATVAVCGLLVLVAIVLFWGPFYGQMGLIR